MINLSQIVHLRSLAQACKYTINDSVVKICRRYCKRESGHFLLVMLDKREKNNRVHSDVDRTVLLPSTYVNLRT